jgi:hypothetical protein
MKSTHALRPGAIWFTPYTYCGRREADVKIKNSTPTCRACRKIKRKR